MKSDFAMLDALTNCFKNQKSAGFYTVQPLTLTFLKDSFHKSCETVSLHWGFIDCFKTNETKPNYDKFIEAMDKGLF